jgi:signal transduction histidine kinase
MASSGIARGGRAGGARPVSCAKARADVGPPDAPSAGPGAGRADGLPRLCRSDGAAMSAAEVSAIQALLDSFPDAALLISESHHILIANAAIARDLGTSSAGICGSHCPSALHGRDTPFPGCPLEESIRRKATAESELFDHDRWMRTVVSPTPFLDQDGRAVYLHLVGDISEQKRLEKERTALLDQVISSQDAERRRIALGLHDDTLQALGSVILRLHHIEAGSAEPTTTNKLQELRQFVEATAVGLRRLAYGLHPSLLDDLGLAAALERHAADLAETHGFRVDLHAAGFDEIQRLPRGIELSLFRVAQEALSNVAQHARASHASVVITRRADKVVLIVEDDGRGIEDERLPGAGVCRSGLGLAGIRERIALLTGSVKIERRPEGGTILYVTVPLPGAEG